MTDRACVIQGDCLDVLKMLEPGSVDAIVTDPPYGIGYVHSGGGLGKHRRRNARMAIYGDDKPFDPAPWLGFPRTVLWGSDHYAASLPAAGTWLAWDKHCGLGPNDCFADCEFGWTNVRTKRNVARIPWKGIICLKRGENKGTREHPTQKPVALMRWCVKLLELRSDSLILDPYMGSGTTGVAAVMEGYRFLGIELDEGYCQIARRRIAEAEAQLTLGLDGTGRGFVARLSERG